MNKANANLIRLIKAGKFSKKQIKDIFDRSCISDEEKQEYKRLCGLKDE